MNLLPPDIMRKRQRNALLKRLAAIQAVIFLLLILSVYLLHLTISAREARLDEISLLLEDERFVESEAIARALRDHHTQQAEGLAAADRLDLRPFNMERLQMMQETLPPGVSLTRIEMDQWGAILTNYSPNLSLSDIHRDAWMSTDLVSRAQLASVTVAEGDMTRYVLALHWDDVWE